ncbi:MAG: F0F1 ATP synthase subunit epsilon [Phycisphaerales bacterium]|nr:F0F1 ATP synthase subunit epsilon [Phycisphaerales bacterium]
MADGKTLHCSVLTPDGQVLDTDATFVAIPAHDGEIGFLMNRAPLLCKLGVGELRIDAGAAGHRFFIDGGFAQMLDNKLTVLTSSAEAAANVTASDADAALRDALAMPGGNADAIAARDAAVARARARSRMAAGR